MKYQFPANLLPKSKINQVNQKPEVNGVYLRNFGTNKEPRWWWAKWENNSWFLASISYDDASKMKMKSCMQLVRRGEANGDWAGLKRKPKL